MQESIIRRFILILKWMEKMLIRIFIKQSKEKKWRLKNLSESKCSRNLDILIQNRRDIIRNMWRGLENVPI